jgi:hypothetical protein
MASIQNGGTATGLQAADYQQQWLTERRQLTIEYLDQIFTLADSFEDLDLDAGMFSTLFRGSLDQEDGQPILPSNMSPDVAESVELFWNRNQEKIAELEKSLSKLVEFPSDLDGWLSSQDEPVADEVRQLVDRMKNAWIDGSDQIDNSFRPIEVWYGSSLPLAKTMKMRWSWMKICQVYGLNLTNTPQMLKKYRTTQYGTIFPGYLKWPQKGI